MKDGEQSTTVCHSIIENSRKYKQSLAWGWGWGWEGQVGEGQGGDYKGDKETLDGGGYFQFCISKYELSIIRQLHLNISFVKEG